MLIRHLLRVGNDPTHYGATAVCPALIGNRPTEYLPQLLHLLEAIQLRKKAQDRLRFGKWPLGGGVAVTSYLMGLPVPVLSRVGYPIQDVAVPPPDSALIRHAQQLTGVEPSKKRLHRGHGQGLRQDKFAVGRRFLRWGDLAHPLHELSLVAALLVLPTIQHGARGEETQVPPVS